MAIIRWAVLDSINDIIGQIQSEEPPSPPPYIAFITDAVLAIPYSDAVTNGYILKLPYFENQMENYRIAMTTVPVSYDGIDAISDASAMAGLVRIISTLNNDPTYAPIAWDGPNGFQDMNYDQAQGLQAACGGREQLCYKAKKFVLNTNTVTPYQDINDARSDFDSQL